MALILLSKTVTTAGTRVALSATTINVKQATIQAKATNTGKIFVGDGTVSSTKCMEIGYAQDNAVLPAVRLASTTGEAINLALVYIDSEVNLDGVNVFYEPWTAVNSGGTPVAYDPPYFDVVTYGADPTGLTDSTLAIRAAIAACTAEGGGVVFFPTGTFKITDELTITDDIVVCGNGKASIVYQATAAKAAFIPGNYNYFHDLLLKGTYTSSGLSQGIRAYYLDEPNVINRDMSDPDKWAGYGLVVENVTFEDWGNNGIWAGPHSRISHNVFNHNFNEAIIAFGDYAIIEDNDIDDTTSWGIDINASFCQIINNRLHNVGQASPSLPWDLGGIVISTFHVAAGACNNIVKGNVINTSDGNGILVIDGDNYPCHGNIITENTLIYVAVDLSVSSYGAINIQNDNSAQTVVRTVISNNTISSCRGAGIELLAPNDVVVIGNNIEGVALTSGQGDGIRVEQYPARGTFGQQVTIVGNSITNCGRYGINVDTISDLTITGNKISDLNWDGVIIPALCLKNAHGFSVTGNTVIGVKTKYDGIIAWGDSKHGVIVGNTISKTAIPITVDSSYGYITAVGNNIANDNVSQPSYTGTLTAVYHYLNNGETLPTLATGSTSDQIITALQTLGLFKQS